MTRHILQLAFPDTTNEGVLLIKDISVYATGLPVSCLELQILPPGYSVPTIVGNITQGFDLVLNACQIGMLSATKCTNSCPGLPDGIYHIRYSVSPNSIVFVEYDLMRVTHAMNRLMNLLCALSIPTCLPSSQLQAQLEQLWFIQWLLVSAKVTVEDEHNPTKGMNQYKYAISLIDKLLMKGIGRCC